MSSKEEAYKSVFKEHNCCVIIPTYNNATKIGAVLNDVLLYTDSLIVVNDGSTDNTSEVLAQFTNIELVAYAKNQGKGYALQQGFARARKLGFDYAITLDSDGQHYAKDIPTFLDEIAASPNTIVVGSRLFGQENMPGGNTFANKFSNFWFTLETGIKLTDTQSGFRLYPIKSLENMRFFSGKYEFELEVMVRGAWRGLDVKNVAIDVDYPEDRISHFRPFKDFARISVLNTVLVTLALLYYRPVGFLKSFKKKNSAT